MGKTLDFVFQLDVFMSNGFGGQFSKAAQAISGLNEKIQKLNKASGNITGFQKQTQKLEGLRQKLSQAQAKVKDFQTRRRQGEIIDPKAFTRANEEAARLQKTVQENERTLGRYRDELKAAGVDTSRLGSEQERLAATIQRVQQAQERFAAVRSKLTWGNFKADLAKSAVFLKAFQQPIQVNMTFEQGMAQVRAVKTMTDEEFTRLETQAKELGATTVYSATQAANTQENLARAGMSIRDITAALPAVLSMAGAEGMDLAQAGSIIAKGLGGMSLAGDLAPRLADILAYTSASSNTNIAEIGDAFKVAAPVLSKQGATMEQIASYIGVMANKGYTGSEAGNALASSTMRLASLPKKAQGLLLRVGLDPRRFKTREGRMVELPEIMKMIDRAMKSKNLGEFEQLEILSEVFGKNQGKAMSAFLSASVAGAADIMQNGVYNDSFGKAAEMNRTRNNTLKGDLTSLSSAWEGLMIRIGEALTPINRFFTQTLTTGIQLLTKFMNEHKGFFDLVIESCYALGGIKIATTVLKYFGLGIEYFRAWRAVKVAERGAELATAATNAGNLAANMNSAARGAGLFGMRLHTALGWIGLIAFMSYEIYKHWEDITAAAERAGQAIQNIDRTTPTAQLKVNTTDYHIRQMESMYSASPLPETPRKIITTPGGTGQFNAKPRGADAHATGGIFSRPHIGLVAEAGPEAIIPLRDKSRGLPLILRAMEILGLSQDYPQPSRITYPQPSRMAFPTLNRLPFPALSDINGSISALPEGNRVVARPRTDTIISQERQMMNYVSQASNDTHRGDINRRDSSLTFTPTYNITVNGEGQSGIGESIRAVIEETMREMMSRMERLSYEYV